MDEAMVLQILSSDEENEETSQSESKKRKFRKADNKAVDACLALLGVHAATRDEEMRVLSDMTGLEHYAAMVAEAKMMKRRRKKVKNNKDDNVEKREQLEKVKGAGTRKVLETALVLISDDDKTEKKLLHDAVKREGLVEIVKVVETTSILDPGSDTKPESNMATKLVDSRTEEQMEDTFTYVETTKVLEAGDRIKSTLRAGACLSSVEEDKVPADLRSPSGIKRNKKVLAKKKRKIEAPGNEAVKKEEQVDTVNVVERIGMLEPGSDANPENNMAQKLDNAVKKEEQGDLVKVLEPTGILERGLDTKPENNRAQKLEKKIDTCKGIKTLESCRTKLFEKDQNIVLRKLLRGPRYFDPLMSNLKRCFYCGEEGHMAIKCTAKKQQKPCFVCGGFGHSGKNCKQGLECKFCKRTGHFAKSCPNKNEENQLSCNICIRCGDLGHDMWTCKNDYSHGDLKEIQCHICKNFGHLCCGIYRDLSSRPFSCYNCGQSGHVGSECTKSNRKTSVVIVPALCHKCGEEGHSAKKCKKLARAEKSKENKDLIKFESTPRDLNKNKGQRKTCYEERSRMSAFQPRSRNGWNNDGGRTLFFGEVRSNVWRAPSTSVQNNQDLSALSATGKFSTPQNPVQMFGTNAWMLPTIPAQVNQGISSGSYLSPQNPLRTSNRPAAPGSACTNFSNSLNPVQVFNNPAAPASHGNFSSPLNPFQMFNDPASSGGYALTAWGPFASPQNTGHMFNHHAAPGSQSYQPRVLPLRPDNSKYGGVNYSKGM